MNKTRILHDLQWIVSHENIVPLSDDLKINIESWQFQLPRDFSHFTHSRIGHYYQALISYLIDQQKAFERVEEGIQIIEEKRTLGEIDFIVRHQEKLEHWEVAIKFYLAYEQSWLGPNAKDSLKRKLTHMQEHQLTLSKSKFFRHQYQHYPISRRRLLLQGRLYQNPFLNRDHIDLRTINSERLTGYWCWQSQLSEPCIQLKRTAWIRLSPLQNEGIFDLSKPLERPVHLVDQKGRPWFVVPETWPAST